MGKTLREFAIVLAANIGLAAATLLFLVLMAYVLWVLFGP
jgi:hypothetical protein